MYITLDIARGIAALSVFLFHIRGMLDGPLPFIADLARFGSLGVQLFFVISGYVITATAENIRRHARGPNAFLRARARRIFPPFWASILVVCAAPYAIEAISFFKTGSYSWPHPPFLLLNSVDWLQLTTLTKVFSSTDGDLQGAFSAVNSVYWTLAIEAQFYLVVFVALMTGAAFRAVLALISAASLAALWVPPDLNPGLFLYFWPMFAVGTGLYYIINSGLTLERLPIRQVSLAASLLVVSLIGALVAAAHYHRLGGLLASLSPSPGFSFALWCALIFWCSTPLENPLCHARRHGNVVVRTLIGLGTYLGVISYSVYLLHGKIYELPAMFVRQVAAPRSMLMPIATITGTLLLCALFYHYVEKRFMTTRQRTHNSKALRGDAIGSAPGGR